MHAMSGMQKWGLPAPFYFLELLIGFVQAFVFTLLVSVYIGLICNHGDDHGDDAQGSRPLSQHFSAGTVPNARTAAIHQQKAHTTMTTVIAEMTGSIQGGLGCLGAAIGVGLVGFKAAEAVGRNPGASTQDPGPGHHRHGPRRGRRVLRALPRANNAAPAPAPAAGAAPFTA